MPSPAQTTKENQTSPKRALNIHNMEGKVHFIGNVGFAQHKGEQVGHCKKIPRASQRFNGK